MAAREAGVAQVDIQAQRRASFPELVQAAKDGIERGEWTAIDGKTVRWTSGWRASEHDQPAWPKGTAFQSHVFLTLRQGHVLLRIARCPWIAAQDTPVTLRRAMDALADPAHLVEMNAIVELGHDYRPPYL